MHKFPQGESRNTESTAYVSPEFAKVPKKKGRPRKRDIKETDKVESAGKKRKKQPVNEQIQQLDEFNVSNGMGNVTDQSFQMMQQQFQIN